VIRFRAQLQTGKALGNIGVVGGVWVGAPKSNCECRWQTAVGSILFLAGQGVQSCRLNFRNTLPDSNSPGPLGVMTLRSMNINKILLRQSDSGMQTK
jgi:hypothetical protein